jgi:hypothetical protein
LGSRDLDGLVGRPQRHRVRRQAVAVAAGEGADGEADSGGGGEAGEEADQPLRARATTRGSGHVFSSGVGGRVRAGVTPPRSDDDCRLCPVATDL